MGEAADDMIDGLSCSHCGIYFEDSDGHPVLCEFCYEDDNDETGLPQTRYEEI